MQLLTTKAYVKIPKLHQKELEFNFQDAMIDYFSQFNRLIISIQSITHKRHTQVCSSFTTWYKQTADALDISWFSFSIEAK